jgi:hypothetical protein
MEYWGVRKRQQRKEPGARIQEPGGKGLVGRCACFRHSVRWGEDLGGARISVGRGSRRDEDVFLSNISPRRI